MSTTGPAPSPTEAGGRTAPAPFTLPTEADVARLTEVSGQPCLSIVMATHPGARLAGADLDRLVAMARHVAGRLAGQGLPGRDRLVGQLWELVHRARGTAVDRALCLFVGDGTAQAHVLPVTVTDKTVVESTFATRDLLRFLHRTPPHLVLRLDRFGAQLFRVVGTAVTQLRRVDQLPDGTAVRVAPRATARPDDLLDDYLQRVEEALREVRGEYPSPLVLAGESALVHLFAHRSRHLRRLAGRVLDERAHFPRDLFGDAARVLSEYLAARGTEALSRLRDVGVHEPHRVVSGIDAAWHVATEEPESLHRRLASMLVVEEGFTAPPETDGPDGTAGPGPAAGAAETALDEDRHDLVDDLIEVVINEGGQLALVPDGSLDEHGRVALILAPAGGQP